MRLMRIMHVVMGVVQIMMRIVNVMMGAMDPVVGIMNGRISVAGHKRIGQAERLRDSLITIPDSRATARRHVIPR